MVLGFSVSAFAGKALNKRKTFGLGGMGNYTISSYDQVFVDFNTTNIRSAASGFNTFYEYGISDHFSAAGTFGYSRLLYAGHNTITNIQQNMTKNFFNLDMLGKYHFISSDRARFQPYLAAGGGALFSGKGVAPLFDIGGGTDIFFNETISVRLQGLFKTAIVHNSAEVGAGVAFHF